MNRLWCFNPIIIVLILFLVPGWVSAFDTKDSFNKDYIKAIEAYEKNNFDVAARLLPSFAEKGSPEALYCLARMYENGWGVNKNLSKAEDYYIRAAKLGNSLARNWLNNKYAAKQVTSIPKKEQTQPSNAVDCTHL